MARSKLTVKQREFVLNYLANGGNSTKAAIDAGYSQRSAHSIGHENLSKPEIIEQIEKVVLQREEKLNITVDDKIKALWEMAKKCQSGDNLKEGHSNPSGLVGCIAELNRMRGHYAPEKTLNANINTDIEDEDMLEIIIKEYEKLY